ncbi:type VII secretion target [Nocardia terrae]|nr:type VII secretion target [Nocardia terrae]
MHRISIHPDGLATYASTTAVLATDVAALMARTATAAPDLLAPAFGLIGTDFLTAYAAAHTTHVSELADLSAAFAGLSSATAGAANIYVTHDTTYASALRATNGEETA